jgi:Cys-tRNA(Pro) deacylase
LKDNNHMTMTSKDLQRFIDAKGIEATILPMAENTPTVMDAARALNAETDQIIKSLIFIAEGNPVLVINNGLARVDRRKLADFLGINPKKIRFASPEQALAYSGYMVGSMPPFGHQQVMPTLVDKNVPDMEIIFAGGGGIDAMMRLTSSELLRVTHAQVVDVSE